MGVKRLGSSPKFLITSRGTSSKEDSLLTWFVKVNLPEPFREWISCRSAWIWENVQLRIKKGLDLDGSASMRCMEEGCHSRMETRGIESSQCAFFSMSTFLMSMVQASSLTWIADREILSGWMS